MFFLSRAHAEAAASFESDFGFLAQRDGVARPGGVPAHTFERKKPPILRLSGGAGQLVAPPGRAGPGAGRLGGSLGGRPGGAGLGGYLEKARVALVPHRGYWRRSY